MLCKRQRLRHTATSVGPLLATRSLNCASKSRSACLAVGSVLDTWEVGRPSNKIRGIEQGVFIIDPHPPWRFVRLEICFNATESTAGNILALAHGIGQISDASLGIRQTAWY
jgi:hypothetical protein